MGAIMDRGKNISLAIVTETAANKTEADPTNIGMLYRLVALDPSAPFTGKIAGAGEAVVGFLQNTGIAGETLGVMVSGISFAVASAAITTGDRVNAAADGKVVTGTTNSIGFALSPATEADQIISVLIMPN